VRADFPVIQTLDSGLNVGLWSSLELDSSGHPRMSYYHQDGTNTSLKYAAWNGTSWALETVDSRAGAGGFNSLELDSSGNPHISYKRTVSVWYVGTTQYIDAALEYAAWNETESEWDIETADNGDRNVGNNSSLALDSSDDPYIAHYWLWPDGNDLVYTYRDGSSWSDQMVDNGSQGVVGPSLALDSSDKPHISYYDIDSGGLKYGVRNGSSWAFQLLDSASQAGGYDTSLALDSSGYPHISYIVGSDPRLKYAWWDPTLNSGAGDWDITTVDSVTKAYQSTSLALDGSGYPHIGYYDYTNQEVKYAAWDGSSWGIETVDWVGGMGQDISLALDSRGFAHISYYDASNSGLKYANNTPELSTLLLLVLGLPAAAAVRRRKRES